MARAASVAVHCTCVDAAAKQRSRLREQLTCTGATPPVVAGAAERDGGRTARAVTVTFAGQLMVSAELVVGGVGDGGGGGGAAAGGDDGAVGDEQAAAASSSAAPHAASTRLEAVGPPVGEARQHDVEPSILLRENCRNPTILRGKPCAAVTFGRRYRQPFFTAPGTRNTPV